MLEADAPAPGLGMGMGMGGRGRRLRVLDFGAGRCRRARGRVAGMRGVEMEEGNGQVEEEESGDEGPPPFEPVDATFGPLTSATPAPVTNLLDDAFDAHSDPELNADDEQIYDAHVVGAWADAADWVSDDDDDDDSAAEDEVLAVLAGLASENLLDEWTLGLPVDDDDVPVPRAGTAVRSAGVGSAEGGGGSEVRFVHVPSSLPTRFFSEDVRSELPYFEARTERRWPYESVLMDEERVLGLVVSFSYICALVQID